MNVNDFQDGLAGIWSVLLFVFTTFVSLAVRQAWNFIKSQHAEKLALQVVLFVEDKFKMIGAGKRLKAIDILGNKIRKIPGFKNVTDDELEELIRAAYQKVKLTASQTVVNNHISPGSGNDTGKVFNYGKFSEGIGAVGSFPTNEDIKKSEITKDKIADSAVVPGVKKEEPKTPAVGTGTIDGPKNTATIAGSLEKSSLSPAAPNVAPERPTTPVQNPAAAADRKVGDMLLSELKTVINEAVSGQKA